MKQMIIGKLLQVVLQAVSLQQPMLEQEADLMPIYLMGKKVRII
jgi:hypothetical protein